MKLPTKSLACILALSAGMAHAATNVIIQATTPDVNGDGTTGDDLSGDLTAASFPGFTSIVTAGAVGTRLASANLSIAATNNITINSAVSWSSGNSFTLSTTQPTGSIILNAGFISGSGNSVMTAPGSITINAPFQVSLASYFQAGTIQFSANSFTLFAGATPLTNGSAFQVFRAATINYTNAGPLTINLPTLAGGLVWDRSTFLSNGTVRIVPEPSALVFSAFAGVLLLRRRRPTLRTSRGSRCR